MVSEDEGCELLHAVFRERGYACARAVEFAEGGVAFNADGWDPVARVGFEYLTSEAGDHKDLSPPELAELTARIERGELFILLLDEAEVDSAEMLRWAAHRFLDEVARRRQA